MKSGYILFKTDGEMLIDAILYRSIIVGIQYCTLTSLDISYLVNKLCQCLHHPTITHWIANKRLLKYLHRTQKFGIFLHIIDILNLIGHCDADWAICPNDKEVHE